MLVRKSGLSDKSRDAWPEAIADDDASLLWFVAKSSFLPTNRRKLQENRAVFNEYSGQNVAIQAVPADPSF
jgi:hypothetical protein